MRGPARMTAFRPRLRRGTAQVGSALSRRHLARRKPNRGSGPKRGREVVPLPAPPPRQASRLVWTMCYNAYTVSVNVSVRLDDGLAERLRVRARAAGESLSD